MLIVPATLDSELPRQAGADVRNARLQLDILRLEQAVAQREIEDAGARLKTLENQLRELKQAPPTDAMSLRLEALAQTPDRLRSVKAHAASPGVLYWSTASPAPAAA